MRDAPGWGAYFYFYELLKDVMRRMINTKGEENRKKSIFVDLMAGGIAG